MMAGRGKPRWCNVDCPDCGNGTTMELVRRHDLARRLRCRCGTKPAGLQWLRGPPRVRPTWLKPRPKAAARQILGAADVLLDDDISDLFRAKEGPS
jgi:hypothetical protein